MLMSKSRIVLIIILIVLAVIGYVILYKIPPRVMLESVPTATSPAADFLAYLIKSWPTVQQSLAIRLIYQLDRQPDRQGVLTSPAWGLPTAVQFIGQGVALIRIEDDTDVHTVVLRLIGDRFTVAEIFKSTGSFTAAAWQTLVTKYGADTYTITTYATSLIRDGKVVAFDRLTLVPENVFDQNYWN